MLTACLKQKYYCSQSFVNHVLALRRISAHLLHLWEAHWCLVKDGGGKNTIDPWNVKSLPWLGKQLSTLPPFTNRTGLPSATNTKEHLALSALASPPLSSWLQTYQSCHPQSRMLSSQISSFQGSASKKAEDHAFWPRQQYLSFLRHWLHQCSESSPWHSIHVAKNWPDQVLPCLTRNTTPDHDRIPNKTI